ncbi:hypothetical protein B566_EDAN001306 [Ephemera danica]|nr:hypothetical protein B566_EDAN001306 [Ephemera danica]
MGGYDEHHGVLRTVEYYNPERNEWTNAASLIVPRRGHRCATYRDQIFAVGGQGPFQIGPLNSVERYDSKSNTWSLMSPMQTARYNFGMAHLDERIFVCGGRDHVGLLNTCEIYHILDDKWYPMSSMLETRAGFTCCVIDNIEFSSWALSSIAKRDDVKLLRDRDVPRPPYTDENIAHELPPSSGTLEMPVLEPLPSPWVDMFVGYMQDMIVEVDMEERNEEQLRLALVPMFQVAVPGPDDVMGEAVRINDENEGEDVVDEPYEF